MFAGMDNDPYVSTGQPHLIWLKQRFETSKAFLINSFQKIPIFFNFCCVQRFSSKNILFLIFP
jgi:hypothetical protein